MRPYSATPEQVERFQREREMFGLRYRCPECAHGKTRVSGPVFCTLGYPNETLLQAEHFLESNGQFVFCKYFELA